MRGLQEDLRQLRLRPELHDFRDPELVPVGSILPPHPELAPLVQGLVDCTFAKGAVASHHMYRLPEPVAWLLVAGGPGGVVTVRVIGPRTRIELEPFPAWTTQMCGLLFRPGALGPVFGVPAAELADRSYELEDVFGPDAGALRVQLEDTPANEGRLVLLERALLERARQVSPRAPCVQIASALAGARKVMRLGELERVAGWSQRQLRRHFERDIGLAPKRFLKLLRFTALFDRLRRSPVPDWQSLVSELGYYDQAHLITEFRGFTGASPTRFLADPMAGRALRHGAIPRARAPEAPAS